MSIPIPLICERCRAAGVAGEDLFARYAALLDFEPVPRRPRADGWDAEVQRAFIVALAATGSPRQAAAAVGKAQFGVEQLKKAKGNEGFMAAYDRALAVYEEEKSRRLAEGLAAVAAPAASWQAPKPAWAWAKSRAMGRAARRALRVRAPMNDDEEGMKTEEKWEWLSKIVDGYLTKIQAERAGRLAGNIVAADFYLRQATYMEVMLDLLGTDGFRVLTEYRNAGHDLVDIAQTPFSLILGEARRQRWEELDEPSRPIAVPAERLAGEDGFWTEPDEGMRGGPDLKEREERRKAERRRQAEIQIEWEAEARRDYERRRESGAAHNQEPGSAGQPAAEADRTDVTDSLRDGCTAPIESAPTVTNPDTPDAP